MAKIVSQDTTKFYHHPKLISIVTASSGEKRNAMTVGLHTQVSFSPPLYGVSISPKRYTYELIAKSKEFAVNFLSIDNAELFASIGGCSGREVDKFKKFNILTDAPVKTKAPILRAAYAAYECRLIDDRLYGDHQWLMGEIVAVHLLEEAFTDRLLNLEKLSPALNMGDYYLTPSKDSARYLDRNVYGKA